MENDRFNHLSGDFVENHSDLEENEEKSYSLQIGPSLVTDDLFKVVYFLPKGKFRIPGYGWDLEFIPGKSYIVLVSKDYALINIDGIQYNGEEPLLLMLDLMSNEKRESPLCISAQETLKRLSVLSMLEFVPKAAGESDSAYDSRLIAFYHVISNMSLLLTNLSTIFDIDPRLYSLREIILFFVYYCWLSQHADSKKLLSTLSHSGIEFRGKFFSSLDICEFDPSGGDLLLQLFESQGESKTTELLEYYADLCKQVLFDEDGEREITKESAHNLT